MGVRSAAAVGVGRLISWGLRHVAHRSASQLPGRVALALDPQLISHLREKARAGSIVICGTNGKTTTTGVVAAALEAAGMQVLCNRAGANMLSGVAAALLPGASADWAVIEADELSTVHILPQLQPNYLVLLNLFRDQLDRTGEIDHVQDTIVAALASSSQTVLLACGDDPLCMGVAQRAREAGTQVLTFGIGEDLRLAPDRVAEARFCQSCGAELDYAYRTYAQLGDFRCPKCSFARPALDYVATEIAVGPAGVSFAWTEERKQADASCSGPQGVTPCGPVLASEAVSPKDRETSGQEAKLQHVHADFGGVYMVYNLLAAAAVAARAGVEASVFQQALDAYHPHNGRLQHFVVGGREVVLNLAKNPTGLNQNISLVLADERPKAVFVVINDDYNDGRDISWIWDVDFERLAIDPDAMRVLAGGHRANDLQVRLKYADITAGRATSVAEALGRIADLPSERPLYVLCNYSALAPARAELEGMGEHHG